MSWSGHGLTSSSSSIYIPNYKSIFSNGTIKLSNKAVIELQSLIEQSLDIHGVFNLLRILSTGAYMWSYSISMSC